MSDEYELQMPFTVTVSHGGPLDDEAFTCGWEMGVLDARLAAAVHHGLGLPEAIVHRVNVPQVDLIAMRHGCTAEYGWPDGAADNLSLETLDEWERVTFRWGTPFVT